MNELFRDSKVVIRPIFEVAPQFILDGVLASQQELATWETWATGDYTIEKAEILWSTAHELGKIKRV